MQSFTRNNFFDLIRKIPFLRVIIPLIIGILFEYHFGLHFNASYSTLSVALLIILLSFIPLNRPMPIMGICFSIFFFLLGCSSVQNTPKYSSLPLDKTTYYQITINRKPEVRTRTIRSEIVVNAYLDSNKHWHKCKEKAFIYSNPQEWKPIAGNKYLLKTEFNEIDGPQNSEEFNYKQYLIRKGIFASCFIDSTNTFLIGVNSLPIYRKIPLEVKEWVEDVFKRAGLEEREFAVISALTCGNREYLDKELEQAYSTAGVIHLLAVSGLHVGIIFVVLNFLLSFLQYGRFNKFIRFLLLLFSLWFYALLAGFSPSIVRACFMFSLFILGNLFGKSHNTYNNIAFSGFILCMIDPFSIFDLSFLLSYLAVLGIVFFQKRIYGLWNIKNNILRYIWSLATVSIAAQLTTLPIILYYFHQFPLYFLVANILLVPLCSIVMYLAVSLLFVSFISPIFKLLAYCLQFSLKLLNKLVLFFESLPSASISGININETQTILLSAAIAFLALYFLFRKAKYIQLVLVCFIGIYSIGIYHRYTIQQQYKIGVFYTKNASYIYGIQAKQGWRFVDTANRNRNFDFNTKNYFIKLGIKGENSLTNICNQNEIPNYYKGIILFKGKLIGISDQIPYSHTLNSNPFPLDYLIVNSPYNRGEILLTNYPPSKLIFTGKLSTRQRELWSSSGIPIYWKNEIE